MKRPGDQLEQRILVVAPTRKDAALTESILARAGMTCVSCRDLEQLCEELEAGAGAALLVEEVVTQQRNCLTEWLVRQPSWSDLPVLIMARPGANSTTAALAMELLGNVTLLERPTRVAALVSAVRTALRARHRQYLTRDHLADRERTFAAQARLAAIVESSEDAIISKTLEGTILTWNGGAERLFGYTADEMIGKPITLLIPPERLDEEPAILERLRQGERFQHTETVRLTKGGQQLDVAVTVSPVRDAAGRVVAASTVVRDIGPRKRAEEAQRHAEGRLLLITDSLPTLISYVDANGYYRLVNRTYEEWFKHPRSELTGRRMRDVLGEAAWAIIAPKVEAALAGHAVNFEAEVDYRSAGKRWINATYVPHFDDNRVVGMAVMVQDITARKQGDEAMRRREAELREAQRIAHAGSWHWDARTDAVIASEELFRIYGLDPASESFPDFKSQNGRLYPHDDWRRIDEAVREALRTGEGYELDVRAFRNGESIWVTTRSEVVRNERGEATGLRGTVQDVTERKRAEEQLRRSHETFFNLVQNAPFGVYVIDSEFRIAQVSRGAQAAFQNVRPLVGHDFAAAMRTLWPEPFASEAIRRFRHTLTTGEPYVAPSLFERRKDRDCVESYEWEIHRCAMPDGSFGVVCYFYDSTELRQAEQSLRESESRFRMLADNMAQLAWTCNQLGHVTWYNRRWLEFTGLSFEEMKGWGWSKVTHPDHLESVVSRVKLSAASGEEWEDTFPLRGKDGNYRWFLSRAVPIRDESGKIVRWFGTNTDITEQRALEDALRDADRRKDEFLATLAHELRNPLAPVRNSLHILRLAGRQDPTAQRVGEMLERQVNHMVRLVDDLLDVARITRGKIELRKEAVEVAELVRNAVDTSRPLIEAGKHHLALSLPAEPLTLDGDPVRLAQILANLLNNAAKYTDPGGNIWLKAWREESEFVVSVRDTGMGIPREMLPRVFDLFAQVDAEVTRAQGGLGIGLTLVKRLVELHGGSVRAFSDGPGRGSEFVVRLPLLPVRRAADRVPAETTPAALPTARRVLVVDDNVDSARSLGMLLKLLGLESHVTFSGSDALQALRTFKPNVVLLDIGMPVMDGFEVARRIRQQEEFRDIVLIALTGWGQDEDRRRTQSAGFDYHLVKPADLDALQTMLQSLETITPSR